MIPQSKHNITADDIKVGKVYRMRFSNKRIDFKVERVDDDMVYVHKSIGQFQTLTQQRFIHYYNWYGLGMHDAEEEGSGSK